MGFLNLLATEIGTFIVDIVNHNVSMEGLNGFVKLVIEKLSFGGYIAVGILLFSLILKIIPLPFDVYSRVVSKKNALKMERMRPELEKLQRQYANNKELYSQKMMALYKKEGYSTFAACLPTIFTLVFFIIVITAFNQFSTWSKVDAFNQMAIEYNKSVIESEYVETRYYKVTDGVLSTDYLLEKTDEYNTAVYYTVEGFDDTKIAELIEKPAQDAAAIKYLEIEKNAGFLWVRNIWIEDLPWKKAFVKSEDYPNIFKYTEGCNCSPSTIESNISSEAAYNKLTASPLLNDVKEAPNGYLILVVLSIGSMLLSQLIMTKSQKAQLELQSVDGTAAQTSKMMMWMMPIMFGIFSFMYTASFSLYLIVSTLFSMCSSLIINKIVEKKFEKQIIKEEEDKFNKRYGYLSKNKKDDK